MTLSARRFLISGRVQGVGFRYFVLRRAQDLRLTGFTRNLADGRVEVLAEGPDEEVARLETALRRGPALSRVDGVELMEAVPDAARSGFRILT